MRNPAVLLAGCTRFATAARTVDITRMSRSIFGLARSGEHSCAPPVPANEEIPLALDEGQRLPPQVPLHAPSDAALLAILQSPLQPGESAMAGFARKEHELVHALAALAESDSRTLHARVSDPRSGDLLAAAFMRLASDRRRRLVNFLADARRRDVRRAAAAR